jgi:hypothetical protein
MDPAILSHQNGQDSTVIRTDQEHGQAAGPGEGLLLSREATEAVGTEAAVGIPEIIAGEVDVLPSDRGKVGKQGIRNDLAAKVQVIAGTPEMDCGSRPMVSFPSEVATTPILLPGEIIRGSCGWDITSLPREHPHTYARTRETGTTYGNNQAAERAARRLRW